MRKEDCKHVLNDFVDRESIVIVYEAYLAVFEERKGNQTAERDDLPDFNAVDVVVEKTFLPQPS